MLTKVGVDEFGKSYYDSNMGKILGYMITWTTYGTWVQGDKRGYVKNSKVLGENKNLQKVNIASQAGKTVKLTRKEREIVRKAIEDESKKFEQEIYSIAVCSNHVHLVAVGGHELIESAVSRYKNVATCALKKAGLSGRIWTHGFDKRFCFTAEEVEKKIRYVRGHMDNG